MPVDGLGGPRASVSGQASDLLHSHAGHGHNRDERVPELPERPDTLDASLLAQGAEVTPDMRGVQRRSHARGEHQAVPTAR